MNSELELLQRQLDLLQQSVAEIVELQRTLANVLQTVMTETTSAEPSLPILDSITTHLDQLSIRLQAHRQEATRADARMDGELRFKEVQVERINIIEPDGTLRLVLSNPQRSPGHVIDGEVFGCSEGERPAGIYFFDDEGNECGGLIFGGKRQEDGSYAAGGSLTFDQYRQDQVIGFQHEDTDGRRHAGLRIWDRPDMPIDEWSKRCVPVFNLPEGSEKEEGLQQLKAEGLLSAVRIFVGKTAEGAAVIRLCDVAGRVRLRLAVNAEGEPGLEFYDEEENLIHSFPGGSQ